MLIIGTNKTDRFLTTLPESYLLIDDGPVIDALDLPENRTVMRFDPERHSFNPLTGMNYLRACQFIHILDAIFPEGESTLTKKSSNLVLLKSLLRNKKRLKKLVWLPDKPTPGQMDAYHKIERLFLSPVLNHVFDRNLNFSIFSFDGITIARLSRAELGDFDSFVLGNLLISAYKGHVVVPDFGFYACPFHTQLIRQGRLTAGLNSLDEPRITPEIRHSLLMMEPTKLFRYKRTAAYTHHACRTSYDDAVTLAKYARLRPDPLREDDPYNAFIEECMA